MEHLLCFNQQNSPQTRILILASRGVGRGQKGVVVRKYCGDSKAFVQSPTSKCGAGFLYHVPLTFLRLKLG